MKWYCNIDGKEIGPLTSQQLATLAAAGRLLPTHYVRLETSEKWSHASHVKGLRFVAKSSAMQLTTPEGPVFSRDGKVTPTQPPIVAEDVETPLPASTSSNRWMGLYSNMCNRVRATSLFVRFILLGAFSAGTIFVFGFAISAIRHWRSSQEVPTAPLSTEQRIGATDVASKIVHPDDADSITKAESEKADGAASKISETLERLARLKEERKWNEVVTVTNALIREQPECVDAIVDRAVAHFRLEEYEKAIADCTRVIDRKPDCSMAYFWRSETYRRTKRLDKAMSDAHAAARLAPNSPRSHQCLGDVWLDLRQSTYAVAYYDKAIGMDTGTDTRLGRYLIGSLHLNRAIAHGDLGAHEKAMADLYEAIRWEPDNASAFELRGKMWFQRGNWNKAFADCSEALRLNPNAETARSYLYLAKSELTKVQVSADSKVATSSSSGDSSDREWEEISKKLSRRGFGANPTRYRYAVSIVRDMYQASGIEQPSANQLYNGLQKLTGGALTKLPVERIEEMLGTMYQLGRMHGTVFFTREQARELEHD